ncbi:EamA family transporter [Leptolyngbya ohadii]|uniref:EamA family transporter n=1 Tax=Leptolyngbya ohadii TaxID=1962290 RepID=UPI000B59E82B|nr:EamA family transporter [Leptolyngbya ohadii]
MANSLSVRRSSGLGLGAIALAAFLWSVAAIVASRLFQNGVTPSQLATARATIAAIGLGLFYLRGKPLNRQTFRLDKRGIGLGISLAMVTFTYYVAIDRLSVAIALVIQYTAPAIVVLVSAARKRRFPDLVMLLASGIALLGVALVSGLGAGELRLDTVGLIGAILSAIFFAGYTLFSDAMVQDFGAIGVMFRGFLISSLFWLGVQVSQGFPAAVFQPANLPGILFTGIGGTLIPFCLLCWGIQQVSVERATIAATLEPVMAAVLAWLLLGQTLTPLQIIGSGLILAAVTSLQLWQSRLK